MKSERETRIAEPAKDKTSGPLPPGSARSASMPPLLRLQRTIGNRAVQRLIQAGRMPEVRARDAATRIVHRLTDAEKAENLKSPRFAGNARLESAFDNSPPMQQGESGEAVKILQQALIDDGFAMPVSTKKLGEPDGIYGSETYKTVQAFQTKYGVLENGRADGVIGRHTMGKLDELYAVAPPPRKKDPEIEATDKAMGQHVVEGLDHANLDPHTADSGIHYAENYHSQFPDRWKEEYRNGYAPPAYWEKLPGFMEWRLKPGVSAADGIRAWLMGLTIAECQTTVIAIEFDTLRAAVGDDKFDSKFGTAGSVMPEAERMIISPSGKSQVRGFFKPTEAATTGDPGTVGNRPNVKEGEWYYFYNHPKYLLKHPGSDWQGENSIYMGRNASGEQTWAGLGTFNSGSGSTHVTEREMYQEMIDAYNAPRDYINERVLASIRAQNGGTLPAEYVDPKDGGTVFEDQIDENKLLNDPPYTIGGVSRKGGFLLNAGAALDPVKVQGLRNS